MMPPDVLVVGESLEELVMAAATLRRVGTTTTLAETREVLRRARIAASTSIALVLFLTERDNLADLRAVLSSAEGPVLLIAPTSPPHAALTRLAAEFDAGLCGRDDPASVREALLVAMMAGARRQVWSQ